jgi:hypothetical protein
MVPTAKLRWYAPRNFPTVEEIKAYAFEHELSLGQAKFELVDAKPAVLQQWWESGMQGPGEWRNIEMEYK